MISEHWGMEKWEQPSDLTPNAAVHHTSITMETLQWGVTGWLKAPCCLSPVWKWMWFDPIFLTVNRELEDGIRFRQNHGSTPISDSLIYSQSRTHFKPVRRAHSSEHFCKDLEADVRSAQSKSDRIVWTVANFWWNDVLLNKAASFCLYRDLPTQTSWPCVWKCRNFSDCVCVSKPRRPPCILLFCFWKCHEQKMNLQETFHLAGCSLPSALFFQTTWWQQCLLFRLTQLMNWRLDLKSII